MVMVKSVYLWSSLNECLFRYQGQYEDEETGLYYNRFRYYSPQEGMYISQDPIRLSGGNKLYGYVTNVNLWVDAFGLAGCDDTKERAQKLKKKNDGKNSVTIENNAGNGHIRIDLDGKSHGGIDTPHVHTYGDNIIPAGPRAGEVGSRTETPGSPRPATLEDLDIVETYLTSQGK